MIAPISAPMQIPTVIIEIAKRGIIFLFVKYGSIPVLILSRRSPSFSEESDTFKFVPAKILYSDSSDELLFLRETFLKKLMRKRAISPTVIKNSFKIISPV